MDQIPQQSIIPKKISLDTNPKTTSHMSFVSFFVTMFFVVSIVLAGGAWFLAKKEKSALDNKLSEIKTMTANFNEGEINEIKELNHLTEAGDSLITSHYMTSPIFKILQETTMKTIRYASFDGTEYDSKTKMVNVKMTGSAGNYTEIAQQGDALVSCNRDMIHNPVFSNLTLDEKGRVSFDLQFSISFDLLSFDKNYQYLGSSTYPCVAN